MIDLLQAKRRCTPMGARLYGGDSSSSSETKNYDMRVVGGDGSQNLSQSVSVGGSGNAVTVATTDHGAVRGSLALALKGVEQANQTTQKTIEATGGLLDGALQMVGEQQQQFTSAIENIKSNDVRVLVVAGLAVVGLGAVALIGKKT